ncbi:cytochrome C peroxidase, partial [bacterium]|nr:cytochrome C peroxidase [bacterium]
MRRRFLTVLALASGCLPLQGSDLEFVFLPNFAGTPVVADSLRYENSSKETLSFTRISLLLSGFALEKETGGWVEFPGQNAWLDLEKQRWDFRLTGIPAGPYRAIRFFVGPDEITNHADISKIPADDPLNPAFNNLHWNWQGGYIFLALEGYFRRGNDKPMGYSYHFARDPRRTCINLPVALNLQTNGALQVDFDLAALFHSPRQISIARDGLSTHSR